MHFQKIIIISLLCISTLIGTKLKAQSAFNLVPNYQFDQTLFGCPVFNGLTQLKNWYNAAGSPDYFTYCYVNWWESVPKNYLGYQYGHNDSSYVGILTQGFHFVGQPNDTREYIQSKLKDSLLKDHCYQVIFYVSLADSLNQYCNNIGAYFSRDSFTYANYNVLPFMPQVSNNPVTNPLNSCTGWIKVEGTFIAQGGESHITIGNFNDDANSSVSPANCFNGSIAGSYYYLDDFWVIPCDTTAIIPIPEKELIMPNVFTPNGDGINDVFAFSVVGAKNLVLGIYNRWGNLIQSITSRASVTNLLWDGHTTSGEECSGGVYFYTLEYKDSKGDTQKKNGYVTLLR